MLAERVDLLVGGPVRVVADALAAPRLRLRLRLEGLIEKSELAAVAECVLAHHLDVAFHAKRILVEDHRQPPQSGESNDLSRQ